MCIYIYIIYKIHRVGHNAYIRVDVYMYTLVGYGRDAAGRETVKYNIIRPINVISHVIIMGRDYPWALFPRDSLLIRFSS